MLCRVLRALALVVCHASGAQVLMCFTRNLLLLRTPEPSALRKSTPTSTLSRERRVLGRYHKQLETWLKLRKSEKWGRHLNANY
jgi:hypothetical protein